MIRCPSCSTEMPERSRFCLACGAALAAPGSQASTVAIPQATKPASASSIDEGRFTAGTVLADRYRVIGLLGQGGMGEVYRANDLKLGQPVALKFLPKSTANNERLLARFHAEVRIARQVSHPNVCRVYDIGEVDGSTFLSMEYVDGEDLRSLLRRIGRLPGDKAVEIARRLCAGLAAAHDKGVLHRDLKPANIMIDGRGQVLITDFGLAGLAGQIEDGQVRDGTPAYMAPEQLAGKEVSVRSDIYALGLVLHEMFTGKSAFENGTQRTMPTTLSSAGKDIDPAVERVILRCLDVEPRNRPASALAVAAALPGGDPLAAALAAGETPTPGMVAASGDAGISVRSANLWLAAIIVGLVVVTVLGGNTNLLQKTPFDKPPAALEQKARDLIQSLGYAEAATDRASGFRYDFDYQRYAEREETLATYRAQLAQGQPPLIYFWYRQSPQYLEVNGDGAVTPDDPPPIHSGMIGVNLDPQGRLIEFSAVPPQVEDRAAPARAADWSALFAASGLDMSRFTPAEPQWVPLAGFDARAAWSGSLAHAPEIPLRIEAASWRGTPVSFQVIGLWSRPNRMQANQVAEGGLPLLPGYIVFPVAILLAWRNFRLKKGDIRAALRLAFFALGCESLIWVLRANHVPTGQEFNSLIAGMSWAVFAAGAFWVLYVALEPYIRRSWPQSIVTWTRLLGGGVRDPLVGAHVLIGIAIGVGITLVGMVYRLLLERLGSFVTSGTVVFGLSLNSVLDPRHMAELILVGLISSIAAMMGLVFLWFLFRALLRRQWLWVAVVLLLSSRSGFLISAPNGHPVIGAACAVISAALAVFTVIRFGMLAQVAVFLALQILTRFPLTTNFSTWYAGSTIFALAIVLALTAYAYYTALAGRPLLKEGFLETD